MAKKHGTLNENELKLVLTGLPDGVDLAALDVDVVSDLDGAGEDMDMDMDMGMEDDPMDMDMDDDLGMSGEMPDDSMVPDDDDLEEMDVAIDVGGFPEEMDLDTTDMSADLSAMDMDDGAEEEEIDMDMDIEDDEMVEISEASLKKEIARLRKVRKLKESGAKSDVSDTPEEFDGTGHGPEMEDQFGGGSDTGEPFVDRDDSDLNTLGESELEEMEDMDELDEVDEMDEVDEADEEDDGEEKLEESHKAAMQKVKRIALSYKAKCKKLNVQLKEANLFNAKLVYTQKLLQNENLKPTERAAVIDALDGAESLREAKKLFATMDKTFKSKDGSQISEGIKKAIGNGSRARKGGASTETLNESDQKQLDRWSQLSGITD